MLDDGPVSRKQFLKGMLLTAAATAMPAALALQTSTEDITLEDIKSMEKVLALELTDEERKELVGDLKEFRSGYVALREQPITYQIEPPTVFRPAPAETPHSHIEVKPTASRARRPQNEQDLAFLSVRDLGHLVRTKQVSPVELCKFFLGRLEKYGEQLLCVVTLTPQLAMKKARAAEDEIMHGRYRGPLHGIPCGVKDLFATAGIPTTWGAEPYKDQVFPYNAAVVDRLHDAGAVLLAKLSLGALAMGDVWFRGRTNNPWDLKRGSSGSSAGSAAATSAGLVPFALGTETLGSIVSPSMECRVTGLRPTYGRVSRYGAMAVSWTMDKVGPICREAEDCALVFAAITGSDPRDPSSVDRPFIWNPRADIKQLKVGFLIGAKDDPNDVSRLEKDEYLKILVQLGIKPRPVKVRPQPDGLFTILEVEAAAAFDDITRDHRVNEIKDSSWGEIYRASRFVPGVEYLQAQRARALLIRQFEEDLGELDVLLATGNGGPLLGITNLTGHPQLYVPMGSNDKGGPRGVSLIGRHFGEASLLLVAKAIQDAGGFHLLHPPGYV